MDTKTLERAVDLWKTGMHASKIAQEIGVTPPALNHQVQTRRHLFPERRRGAANNCTVIKVQEDRMIWVTKAGSRVTLPLVSILK